MKYSLDSNKLIFLTIEKSPIFLSGLAWTKDARLFHGSISLKFSIDFPSNGRRRR
jgi:hypothetical protein